MVTQYMKGNIDGKGDAAMMIIPAVECLQEMQIHN